MRDWDNTSSLTDMKAKLVLLFFSFHCFAINCSAEFRAGIAFRVVTPDPLLPG